MSKPIQSHLSFHYKIKVYLLRLLSVILLSLVVISCSDDESKKKNVVVESFQIEEGVQQRTYQPGDQLEYSVSGSLVDWLGTKSSFSGTLTRTISNSDIEGKLLLTREINLNLDDGETYVEVDIQYFTQDESGNIQRFAEVSESGLVYYNQGLNWSWVLSGAPDTEMVTYDICEGSDCGTYVKVAEERLTYTNLGEEVVKTEIGNFTSYKIKETSNLTALDDDYYESFSSVTTRWVYPLIGIVKQEIKTDDGTEIAMVLTSTNIKF